MNWLDFIASIVGSLAWPALILSLVLIFKDQFAEIFPLLRSMRYHDFQVEFGEKAADAAEKAEELAPEQAVEVDLLRLLLPRPAETDSTSGDAKTTNSPAHLEQVLDRIVWIAQASPRAAILEAWLEVERALGDLARRANFEDVQRRTQSLELFTRLQRKGLIDPKFSDFFKELRRLRNEAVHAPEIEFSPDTVRDYVSSTLTLASYLDSRPSPNLPG